MRLLLGLSLFYVCCSIGLLAQVSLASSPHRVGVNWIVATLAGVLVGSVLELPTMAFLLIWHIRRRRTDRLQFAYAEPGWLQEPPRVKPPGSFPRLGAEAAA